MSEAPKETKPVDPANSTKENEVVRKPVGANSQAVEPEGDRSPIRQERDAFQTEQSSHSIEKTPEATDVVRKPVLDTQTESDAE